MDSPLLSCHHCQTSTYCEEMGRCMRKELDRIYGEGEALDERNELNLEDELIIPKARRNVLGSDLKESELEIIKEAIKY